MLSFWAFALSLTQVVVPHATICPATPEPVPVAELLAKAQRAKLFEATKGEFETTPQFEARLDSLVREAGITPYLSVAIRLAPHNLKYDADAQLLTLPVGRTDYGANRSDLAATELSRVSTNVGSYQAQNAYGATVDVEDRKEIEYVLVWSGVIAPLVGISATVRATPEEAMELKQGADLIVVGKLVSPRAQVRSGTDYPTVNFPIRRQVTSYAFFVEPQCLYLRDKGGRAFGMKIKR